MLYRLWYRRYAPFSTFGGGFEGDKRTSASTSLSATARTIGGVSFGPGSVGSGTGSSSGTSVPSAPWLGHYTSRVTSSVSVSMRTIQAVRFSASTAGSNPMIPGAPDIDTFVDVAVCFRPEALIIEGTVRGDAFPNAEVFVYDGTGRSALLWDFTTSSGPIEGPATELFGSHASTTLGSFFKSLSIRRDGSFLLAA